MEYTGYVAAFSSGLFFGLSDSLVRAASRRLSPYVNLFISLAIGSPILWVATIVDGPVRLDREAMAAYAAAGLLNFVLGRLLFYIAVAGLGAATATIAVSPVTALSALLAWPLLGEKPTPLQLLGAILASLAAFIALRSPSGRPLHVGRLLGIFSAASASLVFSLSTIIVRYAASSSGAPLLGAAISYTVALPPAIVLAMRTRGRILDCSRELAYMVLASIIVAIAQLSRYYALSVLEVVKAVVLIGLFPLHTVAFTSLLRRSTGERPGARHAVAAILAVASIVLATRSPS